MSNLPAVTVPPSLSLPQDRVLQLIKLDRELTGELLLRHPEKVTVPSVVAQLEGRRDLQHWYLGLLFDRCPEMYGAQEFAPFHVLQVKKGWKIVIH